MNLNQLSGDSGYITRTSKVEVDDIVKSVTKLMDYEFTGESTTKIKNLMPHEVPAEFGIGLIVGPSGAGKTTVLANFGKEEVHQWDSNKAVASHFDNADDAAKRLGAVGFNSVPHWAKPYHVLSNGQKFRVDLARALKDNAVIDEFTSVVDRNVAKSCAKSIRKFVDREQIKGLVFASCHYDIIEWLQPDWVFDAQDGKLTLRGSERRFPEITLNFTPCTPDAWTACGFADHHYLSRDINKASQCWLVQWDNVLVGFVSVLPLPSGTVHDAWIGHRTVVLPDFQGMGIGPAMVNAIAQEFVKHGRRWYARTTNPKLGEYRNRHPHWKASVSNMTGVTPNKMMKHSIDPNFVKDRVSYSHEFIGDPSIPKYEKLKIEGLTDNPDEDAAKARKVKSLLNKKKKVDVEQTGSLGSMFDM